MVGASMRTFFNLVWLLLAVRLAGAERAVPGGMSIKLGPRETVLASGAQGLKYFPDESLVVVRREPTVRVLMAATISSYLLEGPDMMSLRAVGQVLARGPKGSYDNGYAGIGGAVREAKTGNVLAFYHGEDQEGAPTNAAGVPGFYCSVALAVSKDEGRTFEKRGPVITSQAPKKSTGVFDQGCGDMCALTDKDGRFYLIYYCEHSRVDGRGVQICLARSPVESAGAPGSWRKYYEGNFTEPGLGGKDTPVLAGGRHEADAIFPHVTWVKELQQYVMLFNLVNYRENTSTNAPTQSGIWAAVSRDGIHWGAPAQVLPALSICYLNREVAWHPALWLDSAAPAARTLKGWLYYSYSPNWGHRPPNFPHYLVRHALEISLPQ